MPVKGIVTHDAYVVISINFKILKTPMIAFCKHFAAFFVFIRLVDTAFRMTHFQNIEWWRLWMCQ